MFFLWINSLLFIDDYATVYHLRSAVHRATSTTSFRRGSGSPTHQPLPLTPVTSVTLTGRLPVPPYPPIRRNPAHPAHPAISSWTQNRKLNRKLNPSGCGT